MPPGYVLVFNSTSGSSGLGNAHALARNMSASVVSLQSCSGIKCIAHLMHLLPAAPHDNNISPSITVSAPSAKVCEGCCGPHAHQFLAAPDSVPVYLFCRAAAATWVQQSAIGPLSRHLMEPHEKFRLVGSRNQC